MKWNWYFLVFMGALLCLLFFNASILSDKPFGQSMEITRIRNIGHLVLVSSGDTVSRVMPIQSIEEGAYKITFERAFTPIPDSLILISMKQLQGYGQFAMELWESNTNNLIYSFVASDDNSQTILPCQSRPLPQSNYKIIIRFSDANSGQLYFISGGITLLLLTAGWSFYKSRPLKSQAVNESTSSGVAIGAIQFYPDQQRMVFGTVATELTAKETQVLALLSQTPNVVVERSRLQKEVWEDQGIIVTRSLDIFISRLRKRLSVDVGVKIVNVHGKGYKLEIASDEKNG